METRREPLAVKNQSAIPKPSRLMHPGMLAAATTRKRPAQASVDSQDKENGPAVKRAKMESSISPPPPNNTTATMTTITDTTNTKAKSTTSVVIKKSSGTTNGVGRAPNVAGTAKSKGKVAGTITTRATAAAPAKKTVGKATTTSRAISKSTTNACKKVSTSSKSTAAGSSKSTTTKGSAATNGAGGKGKGTAAAGGGGGKQKRSPWDLKGRLQDMETLMADERKFSCNTIGELQTQLVGLAQRLAELEGVRQQQEGTIIAKQEENTVASSQIKTLESELSSAKKELHDSTLRYEHELEMLRLSKSALQRSTEQLESELKVSRMEVTSLKEVVARMTADASAIQCQLDATKAARDQAQEESAQKSREISRLEGEVASHLQTIAECKARIREDEMVRRKLHNTIQELKGNIRVFCRVRPILPGERDSGRESICSNGSRGSGGKGSKVTTPAQLQIQYPDKESEAKKIALQYSSEQASTAKSYEFDFDRVFSPESTQEQVFDEISQLVQSVLDGYNVCIFAYGQTGSGKTFTMEGPEDLLPAAAMIEEGAMAVDRRGMISRAVEQVFSSAIELRETGWEYKMSASFLEIYNESLRDLLTSSSNGSSTSNVSHEIKIDPERPGHVYVTNLTPVPVTSEKQVESLLERAAKNRAVATTLCNERSSRSHSVFMLKISGHNEKTGQKCEGTLNLIDLAGSERLSQSGSQGERLKETKNINKSLSNLGNVIMALANKDSHVPYRNSKLTYLLQNSLGGNSKTLMFVNMSPLAESMQESLCSLRFATKVNQCNIGTAKKTIK